MVKQRKEDQMKDSNRESEVHNLVQLTQKEVEHITRVALDSRAAAQEQFTRFARPDEREDVGRRINPATADVFFVYAQVLDPYGDGGVPEEYDCVGREYFAVDPEGPITVVICPRLTSSDTPRSASTAVSPSP
jgi:hypothetical protein